MSSDIIPKQSTNDGAQKKGGKSVISDDILRQLQVMFPWMSTEEIKNIASKKVGAPVGAYVERAYVGGSGLMKVVPDVVVVPDDGCYGQPCKEAARQKR